MAHREVRPVAPGANWGAKTWKWLTTLELPKSRRAKVGTAVFALAVLSLIFALEGVRLFGITPLAGRSMEPTFPALPVWPHLAGYYRLDEKTKPEVGSLVEFDSPRGETCVKRVIRISSDDQYWLEGDNKGITTEDSQDFGWVEAKDVHGVVNLWTPSRAWRSRTPEGRFQNWLEDNEALWALKTSPDGEYLVYEIGDLIDVVKRGEPGRVARVKGQFVALIEPANLIYRHNSLKELNLVTGDCSARASTPPRLTLPWEGEAVVRTSNVLGAVLYVDGVFPKDAVVLVNGKRRRVGMMVIQDWDPILEKPVSMVIIEPRGDLTEMVERDKLSSIRIRIES